MSKAHWWWFTCTRMNKERIYTLTVSWPVISVVSRAQERATQTFDSVYNKLNTTVLLGLFAPGAATARS
ncbi:hypothetical protein OK016_28960 [Vibrio chagasii]|nr:hypothetical protein [Vibrio chagasii]